METPLQIDINDILDRFALENAKAVRRAVVAEMGSEARDRQLKDVKAELALAYERIEQLEDSQKDEPVEDSEPDTDPPLRPAGRKRP